MSDTVLVIRPVHDANKRAYEYKSVEVPAHTAEEQLTKPDASRNFHWKGVRYATNDEYNAFYKIAPKPKKEGSEDLTPPVIENPSEPEVKSKPGRKAKAE